LSLGTDSYPDDNYTSPAKGGEAKPMSSLISGQLYQRQLSLCMLLMALAPALVGNAQRFPAARPREAGFLWAGGQ
jgi:hypothetical protein